eukprot:864061-Ditylum_brightwellii.AAC.1
MQSVLHKLLSSVPCVPSLTPLTPSSAPPTTQRFGYAIATIAQNEDQGPGPWCCCAVPCAISSSSFAASLLDEL